MKVNEIKSHLEDTQGKLIVFEDAPLVAKAHEGYVWSSGRPIVEGNQEVKGKLELFSAYIPEEGKVRYRTYRGRKSEEFIDFVKYLSRLYPERKLLMILDNRSIHKSWAVKGALEKIERLELRYLPTNAPWLNPVESIFSSLQRECIAGMRFERIGEIRSRVKGFFKRKNREGIKVNHRFWSKTSPPVLIECT